MTAVYQIHAQPQQIRETRLKATALEINARYRALTKLSTAITNK